MDLPEPDSPTMPRVRPRLDVEAERVDGRAPGRAWSAKVTRAGPVRQQRSACGHQNLTLGSMTAYSEVDDEVADDDEEGGEQRDPQDRPAGRCWRARRRAACRCPLRPKTVSVMTAPAEQPAEVHAEDRDDRRHAGPQPVLDDDRATWQALGAGRADELLRHRLDHRLRLWRVYMAAYRMASTIHGMSRLVAQCDGVVGEGHGLREGEQPRHPDQHVLSTIEVK